MEADAPREGEAKRGAGADSATAREAKRARRLAQKTNANFQGK
jgi:hypothetical protein